MQTISYQVEIPVYNGPLDLLLQLIEREELDVTRIALANVTTQFLAYLKDINEKQPEEVSSFLVIASKLMQIKSELLLPRPVEREAGEEDPGDELIRQLLLYKKFKEISALLSGKMKTDQRSYLRLSPPLKIEKSLDMSGVSVQDLLFAAQNILMGVELEKENMDDVINIPRVTIREKINKVSQVMRVRKKAYFSDLLGTEYNKVDFVVLFLAVLELVKRYYLSATQEGLFADIQLEITENWTDSQEIDIEFTE